MTYRPGDKGLDEWRRICELNPRREDETPGQWMLRLEAVAQDGPEPVEPSRLPYRDPGSDDL